MRRILRATPGPVRIGRDEALNRLGYLPDVYLTDPKYTQVNSRFAAHLGLAIMRIEDRDHHVAYKFADWLRSQDHSEKDIIHYLRGL